MYLFDDRNDALDKLLTVMPIETMKKESWLILAISEGGVFFSEQIAKRIGAQSDFLFTEAIAAPNNPECVVAMVSETEELVVNEALIEAFDISIDFIYGEAKRKYEEKILTYLYKYRKGEMVSIIKDKNVLLVDEGAETGMTLMVALKTVINMKAAKVACALPVIPESLGEGLTSITDEAYFVHEIPNFTYIEAYYRRLPRFDALQREETLSATASTTRKGSL